MPKPPFFIFILYFFAAAVSAPAKPPLCLQRKNSSSRRRGTCSCEIQAMADLALPGRRSHPALHRRFAIFALGIDRRDLHRKRYEATPSFSELRGGLFEILRFGHLGAVYLLQSSWPHSGRGPSL